MYAPGSWYSSHIYPVGHCQEYSERQYKSGTLWVDHPVTSDSSYLQQHG